MNRTIVFKDLIDISKTNNHEIRKKYKDNYFYFDDDITNVKKNQKLGKYK